MLFSERMGIKAVRTDMQIDTIDEPLKNGLWSALYRIFQEDIGYDSFTGWYSKFGLCHTIWLDSFKRAIDTLELRTFVSEVRKYFFSAQWYEIYDLIEFVARTIPTSLRSGFIKDCNVVLEREKSGYRFIGETLAPITSEEETSSILDAISAAEQKALHGPAIHLKEALAKLSDRKEPDYRNSIKESISAVEAIMKSAAGVPKASFSEALNVFCTKIPLHGALKAALSSLYGYTSDEEGIRHPLLGLPNVDFDDAKYMLVSCSAFINYVIAKCQKADIKLK